MSRDPEDGKAKIPATLHKYLYAGGDPVNRIDPRGREDLGEDAGATEKSEEETEVYAKKFSCADDAFDQLMDASWELSFTDEGYGANTTKSLQAYLNCFK